MKKRSLIALLFLTLFSTIIFKPDIITSKFNIKKIEIKNNILLDKKDVKKILLEIYDKNLIFLNNKEIKSLLIKNSFIDSYEIKKRYPNTLQIKIFEKKPIAILLKKKKKYYLSEKLDLIEFYNFQKYKNLPYVIGDENKFKIFYENLKTIDFPFNIVKKYILFEANRWDIETTNEKLIKLPINYYNESLVNYLKLRNNNNFKKYKIFDYRVKDQLILK
jgi:cell division protein FtsQ